MANPFIVLEQISPSKSVVFEEFKSLIAVCVQHQSPPINKLNHFQRCIQNIHVLLCYEKILVYSSITRICTLNVDFPGIQKAFIEWFQTVKATYMASIQF